MLKSQVKKLNRSSLKKILPILCIVILLVGANFIIGSYLRESSSQTLWGDDVIHISVANSFREKNSFEYGFIYRYLPELSLDDTLDYQPLPTSFKEKGPLYYLLLASIFKLNSSTPENWYIHGSILNNFLTSIFIILFFFFIKKEFNIKIALISSILVLLIPWFGWMSVRVVPYPLFLVLSISALFFLRKSKINYILFGLFAGLAHLTHPNGIFLPAAYGIFLILNKEFRGLLISAVAYQAILSPWYFRNHLLFGDFGWGLTIPFSEHISSLLAPLSVPKIVSVSYSTVPSTLFSNFEKVTPLDIFQFSFYKMESLYNMEYIVLFVLILTPLAFFKVEKFRNNIKKIIVILAVIASSYFFITYIHIAFVQVLFIFILPIVFAYFIYKKGYFYLLDKISRTYLFLLLFAFISVLGFYYWNVKLGMITSDQKLFFLAAIFLLIPLAIIGLEKIISLIRFTKIKHNKLISIVILGLVLSPIMTYLIIGIPEVYGSTEFLHESEVDRALNSWIRKNVAEDQIVASNNPGAVFLRTGITSVGFPQALGEPSNADFLSNFNKFINYYNLTHAIYYKTLTPGGFNDFTSNLDEIITPDYYFTTIYSNEPTRVVKINDLLDVNSSQLLSYAAKGKKLERMGKVEEAERVFEEFKIIEPKTLMAGEQICVSLTQLEWYHLALNKCNMLLKKDPSNPIAYFNFIFIYENIGTTKQVFEIIDSLYDDFIANPYDYKTLQFWIKTMNYYNESGDEKFKKYAEETFKIAGELKSQGDYQRALSLFYPLREIDTLSTTIIESRIQIFIIQEQYEMALKEFDYAIEISKNKIEEFEYKRQYKEALEEQKYLIEVMMSKATLLKNLEDYHKAYRVYLEILSIDKFVPSVWKEIARYNENYENLKAALNAYEFALNLEPENNQTLKKIEELRNKIAIKGLN